MVKAVSETERQCGNIDENDVFTPLEAAPLSQGPPPVTAAQIEKGTITDISETWVTVNLENAFSNPVVVVGPSSKNGGDPLTLRVRNVQSQSFEVSIKEWIYLDRWHTTEEVSWVVVEAGHH